MLNRTMLSVVKIPLLLLLWVWIYIPRKFGELILHCVINSIKFTISPPLKCGELVIQWQKRWIHTYCVVYPLECGETIVHYMYLSRTTVVYVLSGDLVVQYCATRIHEIWRHVSRPLWWWAEIFYNVTVIFLWILIKVKRL